MKSYIVTDFGIAHTRTLFIDVVEGQYRLISSTYTHTTIAPPDADVTVGLVRNLTQLQEQTGHQFLGDEGLIRPSQLDGAGFDEFIATASSAGRPLRAVLVALMEDYSMESARRALTGTYIEEVANLSLIEIQSEEDRINQILHDNPDVIFIAGGTDGGNQDAVERLLNLVEIAVKLKPEDARPIVLYAGNHDFAEDVANRFEPLCYIDVADNVRPSLDVENLNAAKIKLAKVFDSFIKFQPGGFDDISDLSATGIVPTAQSALRLVRYLDALEPDLGTLYLDVGSGTSTLMTSFDGEVTSNIRSNLGLGHHVRTVLELMDWRDVERWLPFEFSLEAFEQWAWNKSLAPMSVPQTLRDLFIEYAVTREIVRLLVQDAKFDDADYLPARFSRAIVAGAVFTQNTPHRLSLMLITEALQPTGFTEVLLDPYALAPALGAISYEEPMAVVQVVDNSGFTVLGTIFAPEGRSARTRMDVKLTLPNDDIVENQLGLGDVWQPDVSVGVIVSVEISLSRGLHIDGKRTYSGEVRTGVGGLIFDMRGRALALPNGKKRQEALIEWFGAATGIYADDHSFEEVVVEEELSMAAAASVTEDDFPDYNALPDGEPSAEFKALLKDGNTIDDFDMPDFGDDQGDDTDDNLMDLRKELGL